MVENKNDNWTFVAVHKSRVKLLKNSYLIDVTNPKLVGKIQYTTTIPMCFKRKKEHENHIFFSLPKEFEVSLRTLDLNTEIYDDRILSEQEKSKFFRYLNDKLA